MLINNSDGTTFSDPKAILHFLIYTGACRNHSYPVNEREIFCAESEAWSVSAEYVAGRTAAAGGGRGVAQPVVNGAGGRRALHPRAILVRGEYARRGRYAASLDQRHLGRREGTVAVVVVRQRGHVVPFETHQASRSATTVVSGKGIAAQSVLCL
jgi:hypothetical protein